MEYILADILLPDWIMMRLNVSRYLVIFSNSKKYLPLEYFIGKKFEKSKD